MPRPSLGRTSCLALGLALGLPAATARADTLVAANGDRLSGTVVSEDGDRIVFDSELFGRLEVPAAKARVERAAAATEPVGDNAAVAGETPADATPSRSWSLDTGLKLGADRGDLESYEDRLDLRLTLLGKSEDGELNGSATYSYKKDDGGVDDNDWSATVAYDQFLSDDWFRSGRISLRNELTSDGRDTNQAVAIAAGWRLWEGPDHFLRIGPAIGYISASRGDDEFNGAFVGAYARAKGDLWRLGQLTGELQLADTLGDGRYVDFEIRLRKPLTKRLFVSMSWNYVWSEFAIESGHLSEWRWDVGWRFGALD